MSKIALTPNASGTGTLTVAAPNTNTDRTITLPDITGTAVVNQGSEAFVIDSSGNVGIGTTSPSAKLDVNGTVRISAASALNYGLDIYSNGQTTNNISLSQGLGGPTDNIGFLWNRANAAFTFGTNNTERMRIDASGDVQIGTTTVAGRLTFSWNSSTQQGFVLRTTAATFSGSPVVFQTSGGVTAGFISQTATPSVAYNTTSDYRLKENVQPMVGALDKIAQLNPVTYTWKADGSDGQGFIAHELQAVVPDCVSGEKDAVDADGNPKYQGVDTSFLVATLVKAVQEQQQMIQALQADIAALKGV